MSLSRALSRDISVRARRSGVAILALTLLGAGCVLVLWPFLTALVWAGILASTSWPAFLWLDRAVGGRRTLAASLMTLLVTVVLLGPIAVSYTHLTLPTKRIV